MNIEQIIAKYYPKDSPSYHYYYTHVVHVTRAALRIAEENMHLSPDLNYIEKAAMLHDIGIFMTHAPDIGCNGSFPYLAHGYLGRELLEKEGMPEIAPICERHIGVGISINDIEQYALPLPKREMTPVSIEEKIVCYADKFYSKSSKHLTKPKSVNKIRKKLTKYGDHKVRIFDDMVSLFGADYIYKI